MTTTYTAEHNPWRTDNTELRRRLDKEVHARQLAHDSTDLLGVIAAYAGQNYDGSAKLNLFPGRALVTPRSDPARHVKYRRQAFQVDDGVGNYTMSSAEYDYNDDDQQQQQQSYSQDYYLEQQPQQRRSPPRFEYAHMSELDNSSNPQQYQQPQVHPHLQPRNSPRTASPGGALDMFQQQQAQLRAEKMERAAAVAAPNSYDDSHQQQQHHQSQLLPSQEAEREQQRALGEEFGLRLNNSRRDLVRARSCKYGIGAEKRGVVGPQPVNLRNYPNKPVREPDPVRDKPLVDCGRSFVYKHDAMASFPKSREAEIKNNLETRKQTKSSALTKAVEELKFQDRAMLVAVPWYYSNHKRNGTAFLGGGNKNVREAAPDFLLKNATDGPEYPVDGVDEEQEQQREHQAHEEEQQQHHQYQQQQGSSGHYDQY